MDKEEKKNVAETKEVQEEKIIINKIKEEVNAFTGVSLFFSIVFIIASCTDGDSNIVAILIGGVIPFVCSILFWKYKNPIWGIVCAACFFIMRVGSFLGGNLLGIIIILGITAFYIHGIRFIIKYFDIWKDYHESPKAEN